MAVQEGGHRGCRTFEDGVERWERAAR